MQERVVSKPEEVADKTTLHLKVADILRNKITYGELALACGRPKGCYAKS